MGKKSNRPSRPMTSEKLSEWRKRMGYTRVDAARELGCLRAEWRSWEEGEAKIPRYIALACAALALAMRPYGEEET